MRLDALDARIVGLLQEDARLSFREIAERLGSTTPTVSARVKALEDIGLLKGYHAQVDHAALGGRSFVVQLAVQPSAAREALAALGAMPWVASVRLLAGGRLVCVAHLREPATTLAELDAALVRVPALLSYEASEVLETTERSATSPLPENVEVPCHLCHGPIHGEPVKAKLGERTHVFCCRQCLAAFRARLETLQAGASRSLAVRPARPSAPARAKR